MLPNQQLFSELTAYITAHFDPDVRLNFPFRITKNSNPVPSAVAPIPPIIKPFTPKPIITSQASDLPEPPPKKPEMLKTFEREKPSKGSSDPLQDVRLFYEKSAPVIKIVPKPSSRTILFLAFSESHLPFLNNLALAAGFRCGMETKVLLVPSQFDPSILSTKSIELVVASDYGCQSFEPLKELYRESEKTQESFLGDKPLLLLTDISLYLKEPGLKSSLWKALLRKLLSRK